MCCGVSSPWLQLLVKAVSPGSGCLEEKPQGNLPSPCVCGCIPVTALGFSLMTVAAWRRPIEDLVLGGTVLWLPVSGEVKQLVRLVPACKGGVASSILLTSDGCTTGGMERGGPWVEHCVVYHWLQNLFRQKEVGVNTLHVLTLQCCLLLGIRLCPSVLSLSGLPWSLQSAFHPCSFRHSLLVSRRFL